MDTITAIVLLIVLGLLAALTPVPGWACGLAAVVVLLAWVLPRARGTY